jgi:hypothetical protein
MYSPLQKKSSVYIINIECFYKFHLIVGVKRVDCERTIRITDQLFKSYVFKRVVRSQSTLQRLLRNEKHPTVYCVISY